jgi:transposase
MITENIASPTRFIGLDIHKHYAVAVGVDPGGEKVLGPQRVRMSDLEAWILRTLSAQDAVVIEMTTNTWRVYDDLAPHVHSVTVVHPPHVKAITTPKVMTDRIAASRLAKLLAKGLLVSIWVPGQEVRDLRALIARRAKMASLSTQAKNRLHAVLHRHHLSLPKQGNPFAPEQRVWWIGLPISSAEKVCLLVDFETLSFAQSQMRLIEASLKELAAQDERVPWLLQVPGISLIVSMTLLAAIDDIRRFPCAKKLVGYAGLGAGVHDSGQKKRSGKITKTGRRDLRTAMVEAAQTAVNHDRHWKAELARLEPRLGRNKAIVAIARKMLVAVWHILSKEEVYRYAETERTARKLMQHAYRLGKANRPKGESPGAFTRRQLDRLGIAQELTEISWGTVKKPIPLPPSSLPAPGD